MYADLLAIADGIVEWLGKLFQFALFSEVLIASPRGQYLVHVTLAGSKFLLQEYGEVNLADKTYSLRVFAFRGSQFLGGCNLTHLGLEHITDREECITQLLLRELAQEIALVFVGVGAC